jgi:CRP-like cAMP-binding protein
MSLLTGEPYSATVLAKSDAQLIAISKTAFTNLFERYPSLVDLLSKLMTSRKAENEQFLASRLGATHFSASLSERIFKWFGLVRSNDKSTHRDAASHPHVRVLHPSSRSERLNV